MSSEPIDVETLKVNPLDQIRIRFYSARQQGKPALLTIKYTNLILSV